MQAADDLGAGSAELVTAVHEDLNLTVVVLVNGAYGSIRQLQRMSVGHAVTEGGTEG